MKKSKCDLFGSAMTAFPTIPEEDRVFLIDAAAVSGTTFVTSAGYAEAPDAAASRIYLHFDGDWGAHEVTDDCIVSLAYADGVLFAVGRNGLVKHVGRPGQPFTSDTVAGQFRSFVIGACEAKGRLTRVRATPRGFVACGWGGQLYRLDAGRWTSLTNDGAWERLDFLDIDGTPAGELYAVGLGGTVLRHDGRTWAQEDMPTDQHLCAVRCLPDGRVLVAGAQGTLCIGRHGEWHLIETGLHGNFWAIEAFEGAAWLTFADRQLFRLAGGVLTEVTLAPTDFTHRLSAAPSHLLSCGSNALLRFDGRTWDRVDCPDMA
jgi:hypothetical protein